MPKVIKEYDVPELCTQETCEHREDDYCWLFEKEVVGTARCNQCLAAEVNKPPVTIPPTDCDGPRLSMSEQRRIWIQTLAKNKSGEE